MGEEGDVPSVRAKVLASMQASYKGFKSRLKTDKKDGKVEALVCASACVVARERAQVGAQCSSHPSLCRTK